MNMKLILPICLACASFLTLSANEIKHPSLLFTPDRVENAKKMMADDPARQKGWKEIQKKADDLLKRMIIMILNILPSHT